MCESWYSLLFREIARSKHFRDEAGKYVGYDIFVGLVGHVQVCLFCLASTPMLDIGRNYSLFLVSSYLMKLFVRVRVVMFVFVFVHLFVLPCVVFPCRCVRFAQVSL